MQKHGGQILPPCFVKNRCHFDCATQRLVRCLSAVPHKFAQKTIRVLPRDLSLDITAQAVDPFGQANRYPQALGESLDALGLGALPPPAGQADANGLGGKTVSRGNERCIHA